jgi:hypothetical protein
MSSDPVAAPLPISTPVPRLGYRPSFAVGLGALVYMLLLAIGQPLLNDPDSFWHLVIGQWITAHHAVPTVDTFSFTRIGEPWIAKEWLSQVLYAAIYRIAGWAGIVALAAAATAFAFGLMGRFLAQRLPRTPAVVLSIAAIALTAQHMLARPHVLALPVMVLWVAGLISAVEQHRAPRLLLLPLMLLWANLHGGFTFGLMLIVPFAIEACLDADNRIDMALRWMLFAALAFGAACITPYGTDSMLVTVRILGLGDALALITEWLPQDFRSVTPFEICLLAGIGFALWRGVKLPLMRVLVLLGLVYMTLSHRRNGEMLGLLAPLVIAGPVAAFFDWSAPPESVPRQRRVNTALSTLAGLAVLTVIFVATRDIRPGAAIAPQNAVAALKASKAQRVFNDYDFGGYLISEGIAPFIDGRTELYGGPFMIRQWRAIMLRDLPDFLRLLDEYRIDATLFAPSVPAVALLDRQPGWRRVYADEFAVLHVRETETTPPAPSPPAAQPNAPAEPQTLPQRWRLRPRP